MGAALRLQLQWWGSCLRFTIKYRLRGVIGFRSGAVGFKGFREGAERSVGLCKTAGDMNI